MAIIEFTAGATYPPLTDFLWIIAISIAFSLFTRWFQKKFAISRENQMDMQMQIQDLKDQINDARGNQELMMQLNQEMMVLFQKMSKKQLIPTLLRSVLWFGLLGLLNLLFGGYDEYLPFNFFQRSLFALYILVSLAVSLVMFGIKKLIQQFRPSLDEKKEEVVIDHLRALRGNIIQPRADTTPESTEYPEYTPSYEAESQTNHSPAKSWKSKLDDD